MSTGTAGRPSGQVDAEWVAKNPLGAALRFARAHRSLTLPQMSEALRALPPRQFHPGVQRSTEAVLAKEEGPGGQQTLSYLVPGYAAALGYDPEDLRRLARALVDDLKEVRASGQAVGADHWRLVAERTLEHMDAVRLAFPPDAEEAPVPAVKRPARAARPWWWPGLLSFGSLVVAVLAMLLLFPPTGFGRKGAPALPAVVPATPAPAFPSGPTGPGASPLTSPSSPSTTATPGTPGVAGLTATTYSLTGFANNPLASPGQSPSAIALGPGGDLWFTELNAVARMTPTGSVTDYPLPNPHSGPDSICAGPDGALWFTETAGRIGRVDTKGAISEFPLAPQSTPDAITTAPDGALWFADYKQSQIGRMTVTGSVTTYPIAGGGGPTGLTMGPDGTLWYTLGRSGQIGSITLTGTVRPLITLPDPNPGPDHLGPRPQAIVTGPDGNLWFTELGEMQVGRITPAGLATFFRTSATTVGIAVGPDGALWFTEGLAGKIGRVTVAGAVSEYAVPTKPRPDPQGLVKTSDGNLWFADEVDDNSIGEVLLSTAR